MSLRCEWRVALGETIVCYPTTVWYSGSYEASVGAGQENGIAMSNDNRVQFTLTINDATILHKTIKQATNELANEAKIDEITNELRDELLCLNHRLLKLIRRANIRLQSRVHTDGTAGA